MIHLVIWWTNNVPEQVKRKNWTNPIQVFVIMVSVCKLGHTLDLCFASNTYIVLMLDIF